MSSPLEWAPLLKGRKLNEHPGAHSDNYGILHWMIFTALNDLCYTEWFALYLEWFALRWKICTTLNNLYYVERFVQCWIIFTSLKDLYYVEWFVLRWKICTMLNDSECSGWFVQCWIIRITMDYWVSAFWKVPGVLIQENSVKCFTLTSELIFSWFKISRRNIWPCPRNWS